MISLLRLIRRWRIYSDYQNFVPISCHCEELSDEAIRIAIADFDAL